MRLALYLLSPKLLFQYRYLITNSHFLNLRAPRLFDEKLIWLNLYWQHPLKTICADKYLVRNYVKELYLEHILIKLLGVYNSPHEIDFDTLPEKFVLKCNHGCGFNIFCRNKSALNTLEVKQKLARWMKINYSKYYGELHYSSIKRRILCEELIEEQSGVLPVDYKIYCFNGKAHCIMVCLERDINSNAKYYIFYDINWKSRFPYNTESINSKIEIPKPITLYEMINYAEKLSEPFPFVRVDLYTIKNKVFFGEMTFTPAGCIDPNYTTIAQTTMGALITLPEKC